MISLILTIFCSTSIALILKHNAQAKGSAIWILSGNYFVAAVISLIIFLMNPQAKITAESGLFGLVLGLLFIASFFAFARAVEFSGTALATVASRLSVVIPVIFSIFLFHEQPTAWHVAGFIFTIITIWLFYLSMDGKQNGYSRKHYGYLLFVLLGIGVNDFSMKIFQNWRGEDEKMFFLTCIFGSAFLYSLVFAGARRIKWQKASFSRGLLLGIPNMGSTFFLLGALNAMPAVIVYPLVNIGIILLTSLLAYILWAEKLNRFAQWALTGGVVAIALLSM